MSNTSIWDVVVIGAGPGGYAAAFRASDLGKNVLLIDRDEKLGGVCSVSYTHLTLPTSDLV